MPSACQQIDPALMPMGTITGLACQASITTQMTFCKSRCSAGSGTFGMSEQLQVGVVVVGDAARFDEAVRHLRVVLSAVETVNTRGDRPARSTSSIAKYVSSSNSK